MADPILHHLPQTQERVYPVDGPLAVRRVPRQVAGEVKPCEWILPGGCRHETPRCGRQTRLKIWCGMDDCDVIHPVCWRHYFRGYRWKRVP